MKRTIISIIIAGRRKYERIKVILTNAPERLPTVRDGSDLLYVREQ